jgi:hypothetical protein
MAAEAFFLFLDKKKQKSSQQRGFFAAHGLCPANQVKPRAVIFLPPSLHKAQRFSKKLLCPACAQPSSVLPDFTRSFLLTFVLHWSKPNFASVTKKEAQRPARVRGRESGL